MKHIRLTRTVKLYTSMAFSTAIVYSRSVSVRSNWRTGIAWHVGQDIVKADRKGVGRQRDATRVREDSGRDRGFKYRVLHYVPKYLSLTKIQANEISVMIMRGAPISVV